MLPKVQKPVFADKQRTRHCTLSVHKQKQSENMEILAIIVAVAILIISLRWVMKQRSKKKLEDLRRLWNSTEKDLVTLHMYNRGPSCPTVTPFGMKLETFLQVTKIKYVTDFEVTEGPKGKTPWITINGEELPDSQFIIEYLSEKFNKDIEKNFNEKEKAVSRAFRIMLEDHFYWCRGMESWIYLEGRDNARLYAPGEAGYPKWLPQSWVERLYKWIGKKYLLPVAKAQGIGRHTRAEVEHLGKSALGAYSTYLGDKDYLLGDQPCLADIMAFAFVTLFICKPKDSQSEFKRYIEEDCKNLVEMHKRLIKTYWPDYHKYVLGCNLPKV